MTLEENYWTKGKRKNAIPHPLSKVSDKLLGQLLKGEVETEQPDTGSPIQSQEKVDLGKLVAGVPVRVNVQKHPYSNDGITNGIVQMNHHPMNTGASSGSWIAGLDSPSVDGNYAIGLNPFINNSNPGKMWGPFFDEEFVSLYGVAQVCE